MPYYRRLRDLREDNDLTQSQLVEKLGMHKTTYTNYEQGKRDLPLSFAITIAILLFTKNGNYKVIKDANKLYLLGGVLGVVIIFTVMKTGSLIRDVNLSRVGWR